MKRTLLSMIAFIGFTCVAMAAADYQGYSKFLKENENKLKEMDTVCKINNGVVVDASKCNELSKTQLKAQCKYGVNPNACKALDEVKKAISKTEEKKVEESKVTTAEKIKDKEKKLKETMKDIK